MPDFKRLFSLGWGSGLMLAWFREAKCMNQPSIMLEWFYETIIKRTSPPYNIPLRELFLLVPYEDEAEFEYEIPRNSYYLNAPKGRIKVFFLKPKKLIATKGEAANLNKEITGLDLSTPRILWIKKFNYPKVSKTSTRSVLRLKAKSVN